MGEGWHEEFGGPHAEVQALADCVRRGHDPAGATVSVSLEPCSRQGKQPPCVEALTLASVGRVEVVSADPSEGGEGMRRLSEAGIDVQLLDPDAPEAVAERELNQAFRKHARTGTPRVVVKQAASLDGRTGSAGGDSRWISGTESRALVHRWRGEADAVAVGIGAALADRPRLTSRDPATDRPAARQPTPVIFDSGARLPLDSPLVEMAPGSGLVVLAGTQAPDHRVGALADAGAWVERLSGATPGDRIGAALELLGGLGVAELLCEGGATLAGALNDAGAIDELRIFVAPVVLGGAAAPGVLGASGSASMAAARHPEWVRWEASGPDRLAIARMRTW